MAAETRQRAANEAEKAAAAAAEAAERHKAAAKQVKATTTVLTAAAKFRRTLHKGKSLTDDVDKQVGLRQRSAQVRSSSRVQLNTSRPHGCSRLVLGCGCMLRTHPQPKSTCF